MSDQIHELYWDSTYAVATTLIDVYPQYNPENIGLYELVDLVENLPGFKDDPSLVTEQILLDIQTVWYEERLNL